MRVTPSTMSENSPVPRPSTPVIFAATPQLNKSVFEIRREFDVSEEDLFSPFSRRSWPLGPSGETIGTQAMGTLPILPSELLEAARVYTVESNAGISGRLDETGIR